MDKFFPLHKHKEEVIQFILDNFKFDLVHETIVRINHEWWDKESNSYYIPSIEQLKAKLKELLDGPGFCHEIANGNVCCGGFIIEGTPNWVSVRFGYETLIFPSEEEYKDELVAKVVRESGMITRMDIGEPRIMANEFNPEEYAVHYGELSSVGQYREDGQFRAYTKEEAELIVKFLKQEHGRFFRHTFFLLTPTT